MVAQSSSGESLIDKGAGSLKPWRKGAAWWLVLIEGLVLLGVGIYMLAAPDNTRLMLGWVVAAVLAFMGLIELFSGFTLRQEGRVRQTTILMGAVGLIMGAVALILLGTDSVSIESVRLVLGIGAVLFGLVGIVRYFARRSMQISTARTVMPVFLLIVGVLELLAAFEIGDIGLYVLIVGILLVVAGVAMIGWAFLRRRERGAAAAR